MPRSEPVNPLVLNAIIVAGVTLALYLAGVPAPVYKGFVGGQVALIVAGLLANIATLPFLGYGNAFQPWKRALWQALVFILGLFDVLVFVGWPAFGAIYAFYFWLST